MANIEILREALDAAIKYPANHNQGCWAFKPGGGLVIVQADNGDHPDCGTTLCEAGWIAFQQAPKGSVIDPFTGHLILPDGIRKPVRQFATEVAELTADQEKALFFRAQDADDLETMITVLEENPEADLIELRNAAGLDPDPEDDDYEDDDDAYDDYYDSYYYDDEDELDDDDDDE